MGFRVSRNMNFRAIRKKEKKVNFRMLALTRSGSLRKTFQFAIIAAVCVFGASALRAQSAAPGSAAVGKIGVINVRQAIAGTAEGKQAGAELQSQFAPRQNELEGLNKQINDLRQRIDSGTGKLSPEELARLQREGEVKAAIAAQAGRIPGRRKRRAGRRVRPRRTQNDRCARSLRAREWLRGHP